MFQNGQKIKNESTFFDLKIHNKSYLIVMVTKKANIETVDSDELSPIINIRNISRFNGNKDDNSSLECDEV